MTSRSRSFRERRSVYDAPDKFRERNRLRSQDDPSQRFTEVGRLRFMSNGFFKAFWSRKKRTFD